MDKQSLEITINDLTDRIMQANIPEQDKIELLINLKSFLDPEMYEENIVVMSKSYEERKWKVLAKKYNNERVNKQ